MFCGAGNKPATKSFNASSCTPVLYILIHHVSTEYCWRIKCRHFCAVQTVHILHANGLSLLYIAFIYFEFGIFYIQRRILRKISGPVNIDNIWRTQNNMETDKLIEGADIVRFIKAQRIKCVGHIKRMDQAKQLGSY